MNTTAATKARTLGRVVNAEITIEGGGFQVKRLFPTRALNYVDPFLLLDEAGPIEYGPGHEGGLPDHPHRGFETLTYVLEGEMESHDSTGFKDIFHAGDIEWTTAGRGIIHGGGPTEFARQHGGRMRGFQLWVNLPRDKKWIAPQSKRIAAETVPFVERGGFSVKVLGGEMEGVHGPVKTTWPILYLHYSLRPGAQVTIELPEENNAMLYVFRGSVAIEGETLATNLLGIFSDGDRAVVNNNSVDTSEFLVLAGRPIKESVARYGPFVMNTREEVFQAFDDYNAGKIGT